VVLWRLRYRLTLRDLSEMFRTRRGRPTAAIA
jgi:transposase-like protein